MLRMTPSPQGEGLGLRRTVGGIARPYRKTVGRFGMNPVLSIAELYGRATLFQRREPDDEIGRFRHLVGASSYRGEPGVCFEVRRAVNDRPYECCSLINRIYLCRGEHCSPAVMFQTFVRAATARRGTLLHTLSFSFSFPSFPAAGAVILTNQGPAGRNRRTRCGAHARS